MYSNTPPNYSYMQSQPYVRSMQSPMIKGRPVSSLEEARAASIDFDGSVFFFPDLANRKIYTKQINLDGTATLNMYELKEIPIVPQSTVDANFITREEFDKALAQLRADLLPVQDSSKTIKF